MNNVVRIQRADPDILQHHGVKGMHWGEWNAETAARYNGGGKDKRVKAEKYAEKQHNEYLKYKTKKQSKNQKKGLDKNKDIISEKDYNKAWAGYYKTNSKFEKARGIVDTAVGGTFGTAAIVGAATGHFGGVLPIVAGIGIGTVPAATVAVGAAAIAALSFKNVKTYKFRQQVHEDLAKGNLRPTKASTKAISSKKSKKE